MTGSVAVLEGPHRPCWANTDNPALARIFTLRRVFTDGVREHRRAGGTREWDRWAGWRAVQAELASTFAYTTVYRPGTDPAPADVALFKRVSERIYAVAPASAVASRRTPGACAATPHLSDPM